MKGPDAAMVAAIRLLRAHGLPGRGRVLVTLHGMHESGGNEPLHALIARGIHGDAVITGELGGGVELPIGGLGLTFWEIVVERAGMAIHETVAEPGTIDPVEVGRLLHAALADLRDRLARDLGADPEAVAVHRQVRLRRLPEPAARPCRAGRDPPPRRDASTWPRSAAELEALVDGVRQADRRADRAARRADRRELRGRSGRTDRRAPCVDAHRDLFGNELRLVRGAGRDERRPFRPGGRASRPSATGPIRSPTTATTRSWRSAS